MNEPTSPTRTSPAPDASDAPNPEDPRVERTRLAVATAAGHLLLGEGPDAITHANVAVAAGVSRTTVYKHWPERTDLLRATIEVVGKTQPPADTFVGDLGRDLRSLLGALARDLADERRSRLIALMIERAQHDPIVAAVRDSMISETTAVLAGLIEQAVADGAIRSDVDVGRSMAQLGGSLMFMRFLTDRSIDDELVGQIVDDFVAANAPG